MDNKVWADQTVRMMLASVPKIRPSGIKKIVEYRPQ